MRISTRSRRLSGYALAATLVASSAPGCFQQDNNADFMKTAPPAPPQEFPNDTFAQRKARTHTPSASEKRAAARKAKAQPPALD